MNGLIFINITAHISEYVKRKQKFILKVLTAMRGISVPRMTVNKVAGQQYGQKNCFGGL
ncbi:MAG: hypothetical protein FWG90_00110 [Oscillospiraceae bacterium]|nr:hypothetical protein [Oscillospiraceae bacterium]